MDGCINKTSDLNRGDTVAVCFTIIMTTVATETPKVSKVKTLLTLASSHFTPNLHLSLKICFLFLQIQPNLKAAMCNIGPPTEFILRGKQIANANR